MTVAQNLEEVAPPARTPGKVAYTNVLKALMMIEASGGRCSDDIDRDLDIISKAQELVTADDMCVVCICGAPLPFIAVALSPVSPKK